MATKPKLSDRAKVLLWIVNDNTERDWSTGKVSRFFVPQPQIGGAYHVRGETTDVSGASDAAIFKSLEKKGLIERPKTNLGGKYIYMITEEGLLAIESFRQEFEDAERAQQARIEAESERE